MKDLIQTNNRALQNWYLQTTTSIIIIIAAISVIIPCCVIWFKLPDIVAVIKIAYQILWIKIMTEILILSACCQGLIGARSIAMDYIKSTFLKIMFNTISVIYLLIILIYSFYTI